jgi:hypothetical protein
VEKTEVSKVASCMANSKNEAGSGSVNKDTSSIEVNPQ